MEETFGWVCGIPLKAPSSTGAYSTAPPGLGHTPTHTPCETELRGGDPAPGANKWESLSNLVMFLCWCHVPARLIK